LASSLNERVLQKKAKSETEVVINLKKMIERAILVCGNIASLQSILFLLLFFAFIIHIILSERQKKMRVNSKERVYLEGKKRY
jgi:hypothetical protein